MDVSLCLCDALSPLDTDYGATFKLCFLFYKCFRNGQLL